MATFFDRVSAAWSAFTGGGASPSSSVSSPTLGDTSSRAAKMAVTGAVPAPRGDKQPIVLGPNVTPALIAVALRHAEQGRMRRLCDLCSEMRETVPHMQAELGKREKALTRFPVVVLPADTKGQGSRAEKQAKKIADYVRMRVMSIRGLYDGIEHLQGGVFYGRSALEKEYFRDKQGIGIRRFHPIAPKRLSYAANWRIHLWDEAGNERDTRLGTFPGIDIRDEWPDKFVIHEPRTLGAEIPTRQGLGRVLVWAGMFWKADARFWMEFAELFSNPWRIGLYEKGKVNDDDIEVMKQGLIQLSGMTTAVFAKGCEPMFLQAQDSRTHRELHDVWTAEISKVVNGGTLATEIVGSAGSRSLGEVHEREADKLTAGDGMAMDETLRNDVAEPLVRMNFGAEAAQLYTPKIHIGTERPDDVEKRAKRIWAFVDRGGAVDADEVREITTGLMPPKKGAKLLLPLGAIAPLTKAAATEEQTSDATDGEKPGEAADGDGEGDANNDGGGPDANPDKNENAKEDGADA